MALRTSVPQVADELARASIPPALGTALDALRKAKDDSAAEQGSGKVPDRIKQCVVREVVPCALAAGFPVDRLRTDVGQILSRYGGKAERLVDRAVAAAQAGQGEGKGRKKG